MRRIPVLAMVTGITLQAARPDAVEWAVAQAGRYRQIHDPIVQAYALSSLGALLCAADPAAGREIYQEALARARLLTPQAFTEARRVLPVPSYTALWKLTAPAAEKCDPQLTRYADYEGARSKMVWERQEAGVRLNAAMALIDSNPARAAQLAEAAISASDPALIDIAGLTEFLSLLRDRAPDLSGDVFADSLDFISGSPVPSPALLLELGKYLFTSPRLVEEPDRDQRSEVRQVGDTTVANFRSTRRSSDPDEVRDYIDAALKVLSATGDPNYDPVAAYAIALQMLPKADDLAPDHLEQLNQLLAQLAGEIGEAAGQVSAAVGQAEPHDPETDASRRRYHLAGRVFALARGKDFRQARDQLKSIDDIGMRSQVSLLVTFAESANAIREKDLAWALTLANTLPAGVKRALLYSGIVAASSAETAVGAFQLAWKDIEPLPPEPRICTLAAAAAAMLPLDSENAAVALNATVSAANDAFNRPYRSRFDARYVRRTRTLPSSDSVLILMNRRGLREVVDTGEGRLNFALEVPGVMAFSLPGAIRGAGHADPQRLESIILGLSSEAALVEAVNALVALRLH